MAILLWMQILSIQLWPWFSGPLFSIPELVTVGKAPPELDRLQLQLW